MSKKKSQKQIRREKLRAEKARKKWLSYGALGLLVVAFVAFIVTRPPKAPPLDEARLASNPSIGLATAKVTVTEFGDFGCHACQSWHNLGIKEAISEKYGDDVQFVWKDFPVITPQSPKAAEAGQCAFDQGMFWEYHDLLYENAPAIGVDELKQYAAELGLDTALFDLCLDSGQNKEKAALSEREARQLALPGTPAFLVNGQKVIGPSSFEALSTAIDAVLATE
ncbi:MAG: thioredoxin domain-containing protein [Chloroflexi bacterium]|nr:thioredoxin domain-containing protein [Chloroflexota bacterium]